MSTRSIIYYTDLLVDAQVTTVFNNVCTFVWGKVDGIGDKQSIWGDGIDYETVLSLIVFSWREK